MVVRMPQLIPSWREKAPGTNKKQDRDDFDYGSGNDGNESDGDKTAPGNVHTNPFGASVPVPDTFAAAGIDDDNANVDDTDSVFDAACTWTRVMRLLSCETLPPTAICHCFRALKYNF